MSKIIGDPNQVLASLLARAYAVEHYEANVVTEALFYIQDDEIWEDLLSLLKDNEVHKTMIESIIELLGYGIQNFREYSRQLISKRFDFSGEFLERMLQELLNYEIWANKYYKKLKELVPKLDIDTETAVVIESTLDDLAEWERRHILLIEKYLKN